MNVITHTEEQANNNPVSNQDLEQTIKDTYRRVAQNPEKDFHIKTGRQLAERLGYPADLLDKIPSEAIESFSGTGYFFHTANLKVGEKVLDLGSGSGMDCFIASNQVGETGQVVGVDMTDAQLLKAECLRIQEQFKNIRFYKSYIHSTPCANKNFDVVLSNGVINLAPDKLEVFQEVERLLKPGGRMILSDIVTTRQLPRSIIFNAALWPACIAGALHINEYISVINMAGLIVESVKPNNEYHFISERAQEVIDEYDVMSISLVARKPF